VLKDNHGHKFVNEFGVVGIDVGFVPQSKDEIIEMMNDCGCCTLTSSSHGTTHLDKICRMEVDYCGGRGKIGSTTSGSTKTSVNFWGPSSSHNGRPEWLARAGMKPMTSIIANFKPNAKFGTYGTGEGEDVLMVNVGK